MWQSVRGGVLSCTSTGGWNSCRTDGPCLEGGRKERRMDVDTDNSLG